MKNVFYIVLITFCLFSCKHSKTNENKNSLQSHSDFSFRKLTLAEKEHYKQVLKRMYDSVLPKRSFNGGILIAKNGEILLEDYVGYSEFTTKDTITSNTPFHIASVSKTFTAMAILKLWEENKLKLEDSIEHFFPGFPYHNVTVKLLLQHRSGLPNYVYTMAQDTAWRKNYATNEDMLKFLMEKKPMRYGFPDRGFHYCNTNFALLALIVEKVSGQSFPDYMRDNIFTPLGMKNSFVFSTKDIARYKPSYQYNNAVFRLEPMDCIFGDKNVYSTVRDLFLWDQSFYNNTIIRRETFEEAIKPTSFERPGTHNYGMGFRLMMLPDSNKVVYHNGWWHGNNACFTRLIKDTATIIITGNRFNRSIYSGFKFAKAFNEVNNNQKQLE